MASTQQQIEELIASGFTREEATWALNQSNVEQTSTEKLAQYMVEIESHMTHLNEFSKQYNECVESTLKSIHDEASYYHILIAQKEKALIDQIEENRNALKSTLYQKKQTFIHLTEKLQKIKQSLDITDSENKHSNTSGTEIYAHNLSKIKEQIDTLTNYKTAFLNKFDTKKLRLNNHWYAIKKNIKFAEFIGYNAENEMKSNDDDNILSIDLMTFNVRNSLLDTQYNRLWNENRRKLTADMLKQCGPPTIIATQEGVINQLIDIQHDLPTNYMNVGEGRMKKEWYMNNSDRMNEHTKIFWNNDVLKVIDYGTFQLERANAPLPRVATWSLFEFASKYNVNSALFIVNTHLSYKSEEIRAVQLRHLMEFVVEFEKNYAECYPKLCSKELLTFVCGDFNSNNNLGSKLYSYLFDDEVDECIIDGVRINDHFVDCTKYCNSNCNFTFHDFNGMDHTYKNGFIDWIICTKNVINSNVIKLKKIEVITEREFDQGLPSDHYPVVLKFDIDTSKCQAKETTECIVQ